MAQWTKEEMAILKKLSTPAKVQDFVNTLEYRVEGDNDTCLSPREVLRKRKAQCIEGAMFAAAALRVHGFPPLIVDLMSDRTDYDHVIAVFQIDKHWGAISKTNHGVLRYREPVYRTVRELVMSYFHEYTVQATRAKTLRSYSRPVNLSRFDADDWETTSEPLWFIANHLVDVAHVPILTRTQIARLRKADMIEMAMGEIEEWPTST